MSSAVVATQTTFERWTADPSRTTVEFEVEHLWGLHTVRGRFRSFDGAYVVGRADSEIELTIDAESVDTGCAARDKHLRSADFFDADRHPQMRFASTRVTGLGRGRLLVTGELEAAGRRVPLAFDASVRLIEGDLELEATITVDQSRFGMSAGPLRNVRWPATLRVKTRLVRVPSGFDGGRGGSGRAARGSEMAATRETVGSSVERKENGMAEVHNAVVVKFAEASKSYQALSVLKECDAEGRIGLKSAAIVERTPEGELRIPEGSDNIALVGTVSGSLIGMLIGVLGGPVGVLVGWGAGALMGGTIDIVGVTKSEEALTALGRAIPPKSTAVIASVTEPAVEVIDGEMAKLGGEVTRRPVADVMAELEAAEEAADAAAREARRALREKRKSELSADLDARVESLKEKLHVA